DRRSSTRPRRSPRRPPARAPKSPAGEGDATGRGRRTRPRSPPHPGLLPAARSLRRSPPPASRRTYRWRSGAQTPRRVSALADVAGANLGDVRRIAAEVFGQAQPRVAVRAAHILVVSRIERHVQPLAARLALPLEARLGRRRRRVETRRPRRAHRPR